MLHIEYSILLETVLLSRKSLINREFVILRTATEFQNRF